MRLHKGASFAAGFVGLAIGLTDGPLGAVAAPVAPNCPAQPVPIPITCGQIVTATA